MKKASEKISSRRKKVAAEPARKIKASNSKVKKKIAKKISKPIAKPKGKKSEEEFPGYPHYPATQDIMNPGKGYAKNEFIETSRKLVSPSPRKNKKPEQEKMEAPAINSDDEDFDEVKKESDLSSDEKQLLESDELSEDRGEDQELRTRVWPVEMSGDDLDVPGSELDDEAEEVGEEDEENNPYSLGGDRHEDMEQEHDPGR